MSLALSTKTKYMESNNKNSRRNFLKSACALCIGCCAVGISRINAMGSDFRFNEKPDPSKLNYCGYGCPPDCNFYIASVENDTVKKNAAYEQWHVKERYGADFEADKIFCFGCKNIEKEVGVILKGCQVRKCAIEKGYQCCIECNSLTKCDKDLWTRFPDFYKYVIELQNQYKVL